MDEQDEAMMDGLQFIFDPVAKTAVVLRDDLMIAVPGRFETREQAHIACLRVLRAKYVNAFMRE